MSNQPKVSLIVPLFNESYIIADTVASLRKHMDGLGITYELVFVDDGSKDDSAEILNSLREENTSVLVNGANKGKGYSVKKGMLASKGDVVFFMDADLSTSLTEVEHFIEYIREGCDAVIGSRWLPKSIVTVKQPSYRLIMSRMFNKLTHYLVVLEFTDTQCGFKCFTRAAAHSIFSRQQLNSFAFDTEILFIAKKLGYRVKEAPVEWMDRKESKFKLIQALKMFTDLIMIRIYDLRGKYKT
jgi:dolichyl-phosphate beta-glucosyltransferase